MDGLFEDARSLLRRAVDTSDEVGIRMAVVNLLVIGDMDGLADELDRTSVDADTYTHQTLAEEIEAASQASETSSFPTSLFCIPILVDPSECGDMQTEAAASAIRKLLVEDHEFAIADGWVHLSDLVELKPTEYFQLARSMTEYMLSGFSLLPIDSRLKRSPVKSGHLAGGAVFSGISPRPGSAARLILGVIKNSSATSDIIRRLLDGDLMDAEIHALSKSLAETMGPSATIMQPGRPIWAAVGLEATVSCITLKARLEGIATQIGRKPVVDMCVANDTIHLVMTSDGANVLDSMSMCGIGIDAEVMLKIIECGASGYIVHGDRESMPCMRPATVH